jgi:protein tyrosine/serine phosphatase
MRQMPGEPISPDAVKAGDEVADLVKKGYSVLLHCSAGKHRTSVVAREALLALGYDWEDCPQLIKKMREQSYRGLCEMDDAAERGFWERSWKQSSVTY